MIRKLALYFHTIKFLKPSQLFYQIFYRVKKTLVGLPQHVDKRCESKTLHLENSIPSRPQLHSRSFTFLNRTKQFPNQIDWNFPAYGKLWTYNLNYFDFLQQDDISVGERKKYIHEFCSAQGTLHVALDPYPISLRAINWIKFFSYHKVKDKEADAVLYTHCRYLASNLEFHLLGNHLLENGFAMLFAAYYFENDLFYQTACRILKEQLDEQVLDDGGHFELSPMYHQIILFRLLDCYNLVSNNRWKEGTLISFLKTKAEKMLQWLSAVTFKNGDVPMVNDSAWNIAPSSLELFNYAQTLKLQWSNGVLRDSGYRMFKKKNYELFIDVGAVGPDYIPGHAHSDTLNFILYIDGMPAIVEAGTSTYDWGSERSIERSTESHNTVKVADRQQSQIWGSFRVAKRAKILARTEEPDRISATHSGYKDIGIIHERTWTFSDDTIIISDVLLGETANKRSATAYIHLHPSSKLLLDKERFLMEQLEIEFEGATSATTKDYFYATGFNSRVNAKVIEATFNKSLITRLKLR